MVGIQGGTESGMLLGDLLISDSRLALLTADRKFGRHSLLMQGARFSLWRGYDSTPLSLHLLFGCAIGRRVTP